MTMSMHQIPLTPAEHEGLTKHRLPVSTPSQLSDCFRSGMAWATRQQGTQRKTVAAALKALEAHDEWHAGHDDHDGYPESELSEQSMKARQWLVALLASTRTQEKNDPVANAPDWLLHGNVAQRLGNEHRVSAALTQDIAKALSEGSYIRPPKSAKQRFDEHGGVEENSPLERLRFFCSLAMSPRDWLDVEPFFDAIQKENGDAAS